MVAGASAPRRGGLSESATKYLSELRSRNDVVRNVAAKSLRHFVEAEARELSGENFSKLLHELNREIFELVNSNEVHEKISGIVAIDALIDIECEDATLVTRFANYLRMILPSSDTTTMLMASKALGHLARSGGTLTADFVEFEVKRALEGLTGDRYEPRRHASVLVLKELADNAPTLFYVHVPSFFENIWAALRDTKVTIREGAVEALRACLALIAERESLQRVHWYTKLYEEAQKGFRQNNTDSIHGSLLAVGELLRNTGDFMNERFKEVCDTALKYRDHRDSLVRRTMLPLIPMLARFHNEAFSQSYLVPCINHLLHLLRKGGSERPTAFIALGELTMSVGERVGPYLDSIVGLIRDGITPKSRKPFCTEALVCLSMLTRALGPSVTTHVNDLLEPMFSVGLTPALIDSLTHLGQNLPALLPEVQRLLLYHISLILKKKPKMLTTGTPRTSSARQASGSASGGAAADSAEMHSNAVTLALSTLGSFDFKGSIVIEFVRDCVDTYLDDATPAIRREAALTCSKLLILPGHATPTRGQQAALIAEVLEKLLCVAISDPDSNIRYAVLTSLDTRFDHFLAQAECIRALFIGLNDENFHIREAAITTIGRLTNRNPAYVMPSMRNTLIHLLTELEYGGEARNKEESARLLGHLIRCCPRLIRPYIDPVLKVLQPKLRDANPTVASCVLATLGELAAVGGEDMIAYTDDILPLVIEALQDQSSATKREVALRTLGQLVSSTGFVIQPYNIYPKLLPVLIAALQGEQTPTIRQGILRVMGQLGALDPHTHKTNQAAQKDKATSDKASVHEELTPGAPSSEEYYPCVAIAALMKILRDPSLSTHHNMVIQAVMFIFKTLGMKCVQFLPSIMPPMLNLIRTCEHGLRDFLFQQLGMLVAIVKQYIRVYLTEIFALIHEYWSHRSLQTEILYLVEEVGVALKDEFRSYIADLIHQMLAILNERNYAGLQPQERGVTALRVLHALELFDTNLEEYLHLVIPPVMRLAEQADAPSLSVRQGVVQWIGRLCHKLNLSDFSSRILHPLARVLETQPDLRRDVVDTLCELAYELGDDFVTFIPLINKVMVKHKISDPRYEAIVACIKRGVPPPQRDGGSDSATEAPEDALGGDSGSVKKIHVNQQNLKRAWEASQRSTKEDWNDWMRRFSVELLRESPSPALRSCSALAQVYHPLARELFNAAFVSCWGELFDQYQDSLVRSLETAFSSDKSPNIPFEVLQTLLNLAEFMEHDEKPLPIDIRKLGVIAEKCQAYAKALHYKELEFTTSPATTIQSLISINNQLGQPEAAVGILRSAQENLNVELKESWYEELRRWEEALAAYERRMKEESSLEATLGCIRCLKALGDWERLHSLCGETWQRAGPATTRELAPFAASAAWHLGRWDTINVYIAKIDEGTVDGSFYRAVLALHNDEFDSAVKFIEQSRRLLDTELTALVGESYARAYKAVSRCQQLAELEEVIDYKIALSAGETQKIAHIRRMWDNRLLGCQRNLNIWQRVLAVRSLVVPPQQDAASWLKFSSLCLKSGRFRLAQKTLVSLLGGQQATQHLDKASDPRVSLAYIKFLWAADRKVEALEALRGFVSGGESGPGDAALQARCHHKLAEWQLAMQEPLRESSFPDILSNYRAATYLDPNWYKAWHSWALMNFEVIQFYEKAENDKQVVPHLVPAVQAFFRSIALGRDHALQDILRLLTLWFKYAADPEVEAALLAGFDTVSITTWLAVIPQIIARINTPVIEIRKSIHDLLCRVGKEHPQALIYPLTVASKSVSVARVDAASSIMQQMSQFCATLVEQAQLVSQELIRVAILWHEQWHEALEESSRLYFAEHNVDGMLAALAPLHAQMEKGPETMREVSFQQLFGRDLQEAHEWCQRYLQSRKDGDLNQAWDRYYHVFRHINKQLPQMTTLELQYVSPKLLAARDLELAVPGLYRCSGPVVSIQSFAPALTVITSKQRPRKCTLTGSDGNEYVYLLKGHEDLRQDERVMQLFGLVNTLLANDRVCSKRDLSIQRYAVIPLSQNSGLIEWVPHCDTLHTLIRDYRDTRKVLLNIEHRLMLQMGPDYETLPLIGKVEVFQHALNDTTGLDLYKVLWLKSRSSEVWLERRTNYTRSLAVMSMVGYILGLGDRHPSNLMLHRYSGKVLHIDFGDCFEVAMSREKFPEKIPFRLTRMLVNAMEVSGIEGNFRFTCENVMRVLREHKGSVMAMLEAFVHDPLINWRLLSTAPRPQKTTAELKKIPSKKNVRAHNPDGLMEEHNSPIRNEREREQLQALGEEGEVKEVLNERAVSIIARVQNKLTGRDFEPEHHLSVAAQAQRLIKQATSHENLCQCYIGWCPFW